MESYTIVVPDMQVLSRVCGTNDSNLKLIEEQLGVSVFIRGNEISVDADTAQDGQQFRFVLDRLLDEAGQGTDCGEDLVHAVLNTGLAAGRRRFDECAVVVPGGVRKVYPRTQAQAALVQAFRAHDLVFAEGPAGSGKTFLAVAEALRLLLTRSKSSIILTRPVVEAGESLGFLPGALEDKISPYLRPLYDAMHCILPRDTVKKLCESGAVEVAPLAYMRGRTLSNAAVILDEAQNTTAEQMKMFLTRMGDNSKVFITGDMTQIDLPRRFRSGLEHAVRILGNIPGIGIVRLDASDVVRSPLVRKIVEAYEAEEQD